MSQEPVRRSLKFALVTGPANKSDNKEKVIRVKFELSANTMGTQICFDEIIKVYLNLKIITDICHVVDILDFGYNKYCSMLVVRVYPLRLILRLNFTLVERAKINFSLTSNVGQVQI